MSRKKRRIKTKGELRLMSPEFLGSNKIELKPGNRDRGFQLENR